MKTTIENIKKKEKLKAELNKCVTAANPEMVRNNYEDEPCEIN